MLFFIAKFFDSMDSAMGSDAFSQRIIEIQLMCPMLVLKEIAANKSGVAVHQ